MSKRLLFLQQYVTDSINHETKPIQEYADLYEEHYECVRKWIRTFRKKAPEGFWYAKVPITELWQDNVHRALQKSKLVQPPEKHREPQQSLPEFPKKYEGVNPRRAWEQRTRDGEVVTLHSYEFDNELEGLQSFQDSILDNVRKLISEEDITPIILPKLELPKRWALHIYTSDKHIGSSIRNPLFDGSYSVDEYENRLQQTLQAVKMMIDMVGPIEVVNFIDLGDGIDGVGGKTTRGEHSLDQYLEDTEQFDVYVKSHKRLFAQLHEMGGIAKIRYTVAANDNHGGFGMYTSARALEEYLNVKYPSLETQIERAFMFNHAYGMHRFVFTHGKDDRYMNRPLPLQLNAASEKFLNDYIDYHKLASHLPYGLERACIHVVKGDLHSSAEEYARRFRYKNVMSMMGASSWIQHNFGSSYKGFEFELISYDSPLILTGKTFYA